MNITPCTLKFIMHYNASEHALLLHGGFALLELNIVSFILQQSNRSEVGLAVVLKLDSSTGSKTDQMES